MQNKILLLILFCVSLSACDDTQTFVLEPVARKQLYTLKLDGGESRLCGVDTHAADPIPLVGLGPLEVATGYFSYDNGGRAFCEIERGYEYHGEVFFDLSPLPMDSTAEVKTLTLTANLRRDPDNTCNRTDNPSLPIYAVEMLGGADVFENDDSNDVYPIEARGSVVDGETLDYRDWTTRGVDDIDETVGINRLTAAMGASVIARFDTARLRTRSDWTGFSIVAAANPDWRGERTCLARLSDIQLIVVMSE